MKTRCKVLLGLLAVLALWLAPQRSFADDCPTKPRPGSFSREDARQYAIYLQLKKTPDLVRKYPQVMRMLEAKFGDLDIPAEPATPAPAPIGPQGVPPGLQGVPAGPQVAENAPQPAPAPTPAPQPQLAPQPPVEVQVQTPPPGPSVADQVQAPPPAPAPTTPPAADTGPPAADAGDGLGPVEENPDLARGDFPLDLPEESLPENAGEPEAPVGGDSILGSAPAAASASTQDISIVRGSAAGAEGANASAVEQALELLAEQVKLSTQPAIANLVGSWESLTIDQNGRELATRLSVGADGAASLTVQLGGKPVTINGPIAVEEGQLLFKSASSTLSVGKVITATKQQLVLERGGVRLVFARSDAGR